jgi:transcriptional antiterminator RfaH
MDMTSSPIAELCAEPEERAWFCIRTHLKHEHIAAAHLKQIAGVEVFNPQLNLLRSTRLGRRWFNESLFPNYVFARFVLEAQWEKIAYTPGVKTMLRFGGRAPEIPEAVIEDLRRDVAGLNTKVLTDAPAEGEEVEIAGGAFAGMKASVTHVLPGKQRAQILVEVMGRLVPAEISLDLVLFNRRDAAQIALPPVEPMIAGGAGISSIASVPC